MTAPCINEDRIAKHERLLSKFQRVRHATVEYLSIMLAVAVIVLIFRLLSLLQHIDTVTSQQNKLLTEIHGAIHEEGSKSHVEKP